MRVKKSSLAQVLIHSFPSTSCPVTSGEPYLSEEMNFYKNRPLDPGLIGRALALNLDKGRFVYGGSTVTQQLVKNLFLIREKSLARKIREIAIANRITQVVSRKTRTRTVPKLYRIWSEHIRGWTGSPILFPKGCP